MASFISVQQGRDLGAAAPRASRPVREQAVLLSEFQRSRLLAAALQEASRRGWGQTSVSHIVARARVSRKTFYELFDSREGCFAAVFEEAVTQLDRVAAPAYASEGTWSQRLRLALAALLAFLERDRDVGAFALACLAGDGSIHPRLRAQVLARLRDVVEEGRSQARVRGELSPLTAEVVVAGVLAVVHARLRARSPRLGDLLNPLMWMIVLPYLGPAAAARELHRAPPQPAIPRPRPTRGALDGLDMRVTYRTAMVLQAVAEQPGGSNFEIAARAGVSDQGQISKLLTRLAGLGLLENTGAHSLGAANAWRLTPRGGQVVAELTRRFATGEPARGRRRGG
jgi:AcrR family transcriptional regulator